MPIRNTELFYILGSPCQYYCKNQDIVKTYKVLDSVEDLTLDDKRYYSWCKWCSVFLQFPEVKQRFCHCPCCGKATHKVVRQNRNGKWYEDY